MRVKIALEWLLLLFIIIVIDERSFVNSIDSNDSLSDGLILLEDLETNKTLYVKVIPGYPGVRSDIYEVYMEPYYFAIGTKATVDLKTYKKNGVPIMDGPTGELLLEQNHNGIQIKGYVSGLIPKMSYKLVVHEKGQLIRGCLSIGKPYNPYDDQALNETVEKNLVVDPLYRISNLIDNIIVEDDGTIQIEKMTNHHYFTLTNRVNAGIIGRTIVMKEKLSQSESQVLCGIIGFA